MAPKDAGILRWCLPISKEAAEEQRERLLQDATHIIAEAKQLRPEEPRRGPGRPRLHPVAVEGVPKMPQASGAIAASIQEVKQKRTNWFARADFVLKPFISVTKLGAIARDYELCRKALMRWTGQRSQA